LLSFILNGSKDEPGFPLEPGSDNRNIRYTATSDAVAARPEGERYSS
jgi:ribulose-bisphosphate carboxylase small chain